MSLGVEYRSEGHPRAVAPLVGVVALIAVVVLLAAVVAVGVGSLPVASAPATAAFDLSVDAERSVVLDHVAGDPVDVETLSVTVTVDGDPLAHQPPVPFVGAEGFDGAPGGPFNAAANSTWTAGERASLRLAATNEPDIAAGDTVAVTLATEEGPLARLEATAR
nr:type IV pilin [Salinilacihabitans rarus]